MTLPPHTPDPDPLPMLRAVIAFPGDALAATTLSSLREEFEVRWWVAQSTLLSPSITMCFPPFTLNDHLDLISDTWDEVHEFYRDHYDTLATARRTFVDSASKLAATRVLGPGERPKHYPPGGGVTPDEVRSMVARDGVSRFLPGITPDHLTLLLQDAILQRLDAFWPPGTRGIFDIDRRGHIGFSAGQPTTIVRFDCHFDTRVAHAYPVSPQEADLRIGTGLICEYDDVLGYLT